MFGHLEKVQVIVKLIDPVFKPLPLQTLGKNVIFKWVFADGKKKYSSGCTDTTSFLNV